LIVENVFYLPGLGRLIFAALDERDFSTLQAGLVALVTLIGLTRLLATVLQALADPRIARCA
ncbi:MAG TPA: ABC transporter permease subunit, partial [Devosia sp.]